MDIIKRIEYIDSLLLSKLILKDGIRKELRFKANIQWAKDAPEFFKDKNFALLAISNDMFGANIVKPFVKAHKINFTVLLDQRLKVSNAFGVVSLPTTFMIDPQGKVIGALFGAEDWVTPSNILYFENLLQ